MKASRCKHPNPVAGNEVDGYCCPDCGAGMVPVISADGIVRDFRPSRAGRVLGAVVLVVAVAITGLLALMLVAR